MEDTDVRFAIEANSWLTAHLTVQANINFVYTTVYDVSSLTTALFQRHSDLKTGQRDADVLSMNIFKSVNLHIPK